MGMQAEMAREGMAKALCAFIERKLAENPNEAETLKEIGRAVLDQVDFLPEQLQRYKKVFRS